MGNSGMAPVCNVNPPAPPPKSAAPFLPSFTPPSPDNPQSIVAAIIQLQYALIAITGSNVPNNVPVELSPLNVVAGNPPPGSLPSGGGSTTTSSSTTTGGSGKKSTNNPKHNYGEFIEVPNSRVYKLVKVMNPQNHSQYVMVKQIMHLTMRDKITGVKWIWNHGPITPQG